MNKDIIFYNPKKLKQSKNWLEYERIKNGWIHFSMAWIKRLTKRLDKLYKDMVINTNNMKP